MDKENFIKESIPAVISDIRPEEGQTRTAEELRLYYLGFKTAIYLMEPNLEEEEVQELVEDIEHEASFSK